MKRCVSVLLAGVLLVGMLAFFAPVTAVAESLYIRKIVSVVYDDSGSMVNDNREAYANYAMQAFAGMLNSEDKLFITYMNASQTFGNQYQPDTVDLSAGGIQGSVDAIRGHRANGNTPYQAVVSAFDKLKGVQDSNPNTQYWLVVITDGNFGYKESELTKMFKGYVSETMPNGTKPQATFLAIGKKKDVYMPKQDTAAGIYTYNAAEANDIVQVMSSMADRISGRTRLEMKDVAQLDANTLQVSSSIPLLNVAVLSQKTDAALMQVVYSNETEIPIGRRVSLSYPSDSSLTGGAFLVGDSQKVIDAGTYKLRFDKPVNAADVVVMLEPALEMRVTVSVNGKEVADKSELLGATEGDKVSISCKIYEMGTNNEVSPDLLPPNTKFEVGVKENGQTVKTGDGKTMVLDEYVLTDQPTEITAAVTIDGFNPIMYQAQFTPAEKPIVYTITPGFGGDKQSVKYNEIASNRDMTVTFTVAADGVTLTDRASVEALAPMVTVSPAGNAGATVVRDDGVIEFTPTAASAAGGEFFDVEVTCKIAEVSAKQSYRVIIADYEVIPLGADGTVRKTEWYGSTAGVSFYVTKDGVRLNKQAVENKFSVKLSEGYEHLKAETTVESDGTIRVVPSAETEHTVTFGSWWFNWYRYFSLPRGDAQVTLLHAYGDATVAIPVKEAKMGYLIGCVYLPLLLELLLLAAIIAYIVRYVTKARFAANAALYVGSITRNRRQAGAHRMELRKVPLSQYNTFANLWNPFKELTVSVGGISITAAKDGKILCNEDFPWYADSVRSRIRTVTVQTPQDVVDYCLEHDELEIAEIRPTAVMDEQAALISRDESVYYFVRADVVNARMQGGNHMEVIDSALAFCYYVE